MHLVSVTRLRVRSWRFLPGFVLDAVRSVMQARATPGCVDVQTRRTAGNVFWTTTVWTTEAAMKSFRNAGVHQRAMRTLSEICDEASYVHWTQEDSKPPSWVEGHSRLCTEGKLSKVKHPSPLQVAGKTAELP
jgi:heme-degrading monooxygenase HmoA